MESGIEGSQTVESRKQAAAAAADVLLLYFELFYLNVCGARSIFVMDRVFVCEIRHLDIMEVRGVMLGQKDGSKGSG